MNENRQVGKRAILDTASLRDLVEDLALTKPPATDTEAAEQLAECERLKSALCALQATVTERLASEHQTAAGKTAASVATEVGLARQESPHVGQRKTKLAVALVRDLPATHLALACGDLNEKRAQIIADETSFLTREDRLEVDRQITRQLDGLGDKALTNKVRRLVQQIDEEATLKRRKRAQDNRRFSGRILNDGTAQLTLTVPDTVFPAIVGSLDKEAARRRAAGDGRNRSQLTADIAAERLAGHQEGKVEPVAVQLVVSAETLLGDDSTPGHLPGVGPIPASVARNMVAASDEVRSTIRRLFAIPQDGSLVTMESGQRCFPALLHQLIRLRDDICRTPYCNAPIRHADHIMAASRGGATDVVNGQGLCEWCNYVKEQKGWRHEPGPPDRRHEVSITTPTGHRHRSREPGVPIPRPRPWGGLEVMFVDLVLAA